MFHKEIKEAVQIDEKSIFPPDLLDLFVQTDKDTSQGDQYGSVKKNKKISIPFLLFSSLPP